MSNAPSTGPASVETQEIDDVAVICATGNLCGYPEGMLRKATVDVLTAGFRMVIFDLSDLSGMDCKGLSDFVGACEEALSQGAIYVGVAWASYFTTDPVHGPVSFNPVIEFFENREEALKALHWERDFDL